jgi:sugar/nucleoside kinase (ribokinase family)
VMLERSLILGNATECAACFGTAEPDALAAARAAASEALVVKSGGDGCVLIDDGTVTRLPAAARVVAADSTGAGDAFDAAFIAARLRGASLEGACASGNAAGAMAAAARGPRPEGLAALVDLADVDLAGSP